MRILIAEDSAAVRNRLVAEITRIKRARIVGSTGDGTLVLGMMRDLKPDLVVLDLQLSRGSGMEVIRAVRRDRMPATIMVLTNFATAYHYELCRKLGAGYFFDKITEIDEAFAVIRELSGGGADKDDEPLVTMAGWTDWGGNEKRSERAYNES
jgi:two-component system response regulator DevR